MADEHARQLMEISVARTACALGLKETSKDVVDSLSDIVKHFVQLVAERSVEQAEMGGRAMVGIQDVLSVLGTSSFRASSWKDLRDFAFADVKNPIETVKWSQPFPHDVPIFPSRRSGVSKRRFNELEEENDSAASSSTSSNNIPAHLPPFPASRMYSRTKRNMSSGKVPSEQAREQKIKLISSVKAVQSSLSNIESANDGA